MKLRGKTAIITGASSGIGEATARLLHAEGCNVVLAARREDRLQDLASDLGDRTLPVPADVTDPAASESLVSLAEERFGAVDILVNNAGLGVYAPIQEADPADWRTMFDVNVLAVLYVTQAALRRMLPNGSGDVVFISSKAGRRVPRPEATVYAATKHAITAVAEGLRMDLSPKGIRVTAVEPGLVRTEFPEGTYESAEEFYEQREYAPLEAVDVAEAVLYACSQPARVSVNEVLLLSSEQP